MPSLAGKLFGSRSDDNAPATGVRTAPDALWRTPWRWRDVGGTYVGADGSAWLYVDATQVIESSPDPAAWVDQVIASLAADERQADSWRSGEDRREVHLVAVALTGKPVLPPAPDGLAGHLAGLLRVLVPVRSVLVGVRLAAVGEAAKTSLGEQLTQSVVRLMGEDVPRFDAFEADRERVEALLASHGLRPARESVLRQLEEWLFLSTSASMLVHERPEVCLLDDGDRIEAVAAAAVAAQAEDPLRQAVTHTLPSRSSVTSVRGTVTGPGSHARQTRPFLDDVSVVFARRASGAREPLIDELQALPGVRVKPLEHRQLRALEETLPCGVTRTSPYLKEVGGIDLQRTGLFGFTHTGEARGLYAGFSRPAYQLSFLDPELRVEGAPLTGIAGGQGSGKSTLAATLLHQAVLAGAEVVAVHVGGGPVGEAMKLAGGRSVAWSALARRAGSCDPFALLPAEVAAQVTLYALGESFPPDTFSAAEQQQLMDAFTQAGLVEAADGRTALTCIRDAELRAKVERLASTPGVLHSMLAPPPGGAAIAGTLHASGQGPLAFTVPVGSRPAARMLSRLALLRAGDRTTVIDPADALLGAGDIAQVLARAWRGGVHAICTAADARAFVASEFLVGSLARALVFPGVDSGVAAAMLACADDPRLRSWLEFESGGTLASRPHEALYRDARGRLSALVIAPVDPRLLVDEASAGTR